MKWSIPIILMLCLLQISCGRIRGKRSPLQSQSPLENDQLCPIEDPALKNLWDKNQTQLQRIENLALEKFQENLKNLYSGNFIRENLGGQSPLRPLVISLKDLEKKISALEDKIFEIETDPHFNQAKVLRVLYQKSKSILDQVNRINVASCRQDKKKAGQEEFLYKDARAWSRLQNALIISCPQELNREEEMGLECFNSFLQQPKIQVIEDIKELCQQLQFQQKCPIKNGDGPALSQLLKLGKQKLWDDSFKIMSREGLFFRCVEEDNQKVMEIPFNADLSPTQREKLQQALTKYWSKKDILLLRPIFGESNKGIKVKATSLSSSFVLENDRQSIYMSNSFEGESETYYRVLAHELGHVFGFDDCYREYYDKNQELYIYYALDENHLMCSTGPMARISDESLQELAKQRCF